MCVYVCVRVTFQFSRSSLERRVSDEKKWHVSYFEVNFQRKESYDDECLTTFLLERLMCFNVLYTNGSKARKCVRFLGMKTR